MSELRWDFDVMKARTIIETLSGSVAAMERKGFGKLVERLEAGGVRIVIKLDRLGRNAMEARYRCFVRLRYKDLSYVHL